MLLPNHPNWAVQEWTRDKSSKSWWICSATVYRQNRPIVHRQNHELVSMGKVLQQIACSATTHRQKSQVYGLPSRMENLRHVLKLFVVWSLFLKKLSRTYENVRETPSNFSKIFCFVKTMSRDFSKIYKKVAVELCNCLNFEMWSAIYDNFSFFVYISKCGVDEWLKLYSTLQLYAWKWINPAHCPKTVQLIK